MVSRFGVVLVDATSYKVFVNCNSCYPRIASGTARKTLGTPGSARIPWPTDVINRPSWARATPAHATQSELGHQALKCAVGLCLVFYSILISEVRC